MEDLSFELHFGVDLAESDVVDRLAEVLGDVAPGFASELRVLEYERDRAALSVDVHRPGDLQRAVLDKGGRRGVVFQQLDADRPAAFPRRFGEVLLRGTARSTFLTVRFDEHTPAMRSGDRWLFSNSIGGWVGAERVDGVPRLSWVRQVCLRLADHPDFLWGAAFDGGEFRARNLHDDDKGQWAIGRDVRRSLPGLFWLNLFGPPYRDLIGVDALRSAPATTAVESVHSMSLELYDDPADWADVGCQELHAAAVRHLGPAYFFDRAAPDVPTKAPAFGLEELPPRPSFKVVSGDGDTFTPLPDLG